jgi:hypothetical protein
MKDFVTRRELMNGMLCAAAALPALAVWSPRAHAAGLTPLDANDPAAKALGYTGDSAKVDAAANPTHKTDQSCGNCAQFVEATGGCNVFPGKSVPKTGWCKVWAKKAGS